ncbi:MAG: restriction endonuclease subunit S, partial [Planctomycetota bacterium]|nr:restriction endonuclease subunit S [Planctomycetota bacterium]
PRKSQLADLSPDTLVSFVPMADLNEHRIEFQPTQDKRLSEVSASYTYFEDNDVLLAKVTPCFENGKAGIARGLLNGRGFGSSEFYVLRLTSQVLPEWAYFCVSHPLFREAAIAQMTGTGGLQRVPRSYVEDSKIPLPPLEVQTEIVAEIKGYQNVIDGARAVLDNYRPHIPIHPDWPTTTIGETCALSSGGTPSKANENYWIGDIPWVSGKDMKLDRIGDAALHISKSAVEESATKIAPVGSLLILVRGMGLANGIPIAEVTSPCAFNQDIRAIHPPQGVSPSFLLFTLRSHLSQFEKVLNTAAHGTLKIDTDDLRNIRFPLPPLATQQAIVAEIEAEQALVAANRELIARFEKKIQAALARPFRASVLNPLLTQGGATRRTPLRSALGCYVAAPIGAKTCGSRPGRCPDLSCAPLRGKQRNRLSPLPPGQFSCQLVAQDCPPNATVASAAFRKLQPSTNRTI